ncbi:methyl-accepting chemotaxis protein [Halorubrum tebenquichense]|uniref:Methyl-accepting chemotaxis sensory transducer n=1 Tax=Halorubrum tebenquichense DSM 14210 TaxID=1227485 RepID=M0DVX2_9EURY|nr:methyl-accepting chemotaxis protein [Halorubrum tebenquichense]ELZ38862.1 methyl-accepting chemotaxis sensory transducer [Halorubrum tebenquichense DSM 14210]
MARNPLNWLRRSYLRKLLSLLLVVGVLVGAVGGVIYVQTTGVIADNTESELTKSAEIQASTVAEWSDRNRDHVATLASRDAVKSGDDAAIAEMLSAETSQLPDSATGIHLVAADTGAVTASSDAEATGASYGEVRWLELDGRLPEAGETTVTTSYTDPITGSDAVAFVAAVPGSDDLVVLPVDLAARSAELSTPVDAQGAFSVAVNDDGFVVLSQDGEKINRQNMGDAAEMSVSSMAVKRGLDGEVGYMEMEMGGERMAMGFAPIEGTDWVLMTHVPAETAFAVQGFVQLTVLALTAVSILGLGVVGVFVGRNTTQSIRDLVATADEFEGGRLDADLTTDRVDEIGRLYAAFDDMRNSLRTSLSDAREAEREATEARERAEEFSQHVEAKAAQYEDQIEAAAAGDLTRRVDTESESRAMTDIGVALNEMLADLEATVADVQAFANAVETATTDATAGTDEVETASQRVSDSIQQIAAEADEQRDNLRTVSTEMTELSATIEEAASTADTVAATSQETAEIASEGEATATRSVEEMETAQTAMSSAVENVEALDNLMSEIDEIVAVIGEIAEQTNMLALNANIEAARAQGDDGGDGFAVVASEVKQLAEETQASADDVAHLIDEVQETTEQTTTDIRDADQRVRETTDAVEETVDAFVTVSENVRDTNNGVQEISDAMDDQAVSAEAVVTMVDDVETQSESAADAAENVSAASEEQAASITQVSETVDGLATQADRLQDVLETFTTRLDADESGPTAEPSGDRVSSAASGERGATEQPTTD